MYISSLNFTLTFPKVFGKWGYIVNTNKNARSYALTRHHTYDAASGNAMAGISESDWRKHINDLVNDAWNTGEIELIAYVFHDKDIDKNGGKVPLHAHLLVRFKESTSHQKAMTLFQATSVKNCQPVKNHLATARYLIHISESAINEEKTIYSPDEVMVFGNVTPRDLLKKSYWGNKEKKDANAERLVTHEVAQGIADSLGKKIRDGKVSVKRALELLEERAGYGYVRVHKASFEADYQLRLEKIVELFKKHGRDLINLYIAGRGGSGKSTLASRIAQWISEMLACDGDYYMAAPHGEGKTPDLFGSYNGEPVCVLNELTASSFGLDEFLMTFDPYVYSQISSRNVNRELTASWTISTNSFSMFKFSRDLLLYSKGGKRFASKSNPNALDDKSEMVMDKYWQVRRRFRHYLHLVQKSPNEYEVRVYKLGNYAEGDGDHFYVGSVYYTKDANGKPLYTNSFMEELVDLLINSQVDFSSEKASEFIEAIGYDEVPIDENMEGFFEDFVTKCQWELLPLDFLYDGYLLYMAKNERSSKPLGKQAFKAAFVDYAEANVEKLGKTYTYGRYYSNGKMTDLSGAVIDEPLITEYGLHLPESLASRYPHTSPWCNVPYKGSDLLIVRQFHVRDRYYGFLVEDI